MAELPENTHLSHAELSEMANTSPAVAATVLAKQLNDASATLEKEVAQKKKRVKELRLKAEHKEAEVALLRSELAWLTKRKHGQAAAASNAAHNLTVAVLTTPTS